MIGSGLSGPLKELVLFVGSSHFSVECFVALVVLMILSFLLFSPILFV